MFDIVTYIDIPDEDKVHYWNEQHLPYPGCPVSFKMLKHLVLICHRLPERFATEKAQAVKETLGQVFFEQLRTFDGDPINYCQFLFPRKNKTLFVPLAEDWDYKTDLQLVKILYRKSE